MCVAIGALSHQRERAFSASLLYLGLGAAAAVAIAVFDVEWLEPIEDATAVEHLAEVALVAALFSSGMKLDRRLRLSEWGSVLRLLAIAMPLSIAAVALFGYGVMGLSVGAAIVLGAVLAPTDPVLAGDIGVGPPSDEDEHEPNFALTAEAGLNDGLAAPFVLAGLLIAGSGDDRDGWFEWATFDVFYAIGIGLAIGAMVGYGLGAAVVRLRDRDLLSHALDPWVAVAASLVIYGTVELIDGYGFIAVFAGGLTFRRYERGHEVNARVHHGAELVEKFLELAVILALGSMLTITGLQAPGVEGWVLAVLLIVLIRPLTSLVALLGGRMETKGENYFVAWFGVRGVGTLFYAALAAEMGVLGADEIEIVVWTAIACVLVSIPVHGITAAPGTRRMLASRDRR